MLLYMYLVTEAMNVFIQFHEDDMTGRSKNTVGLLSYGARGAAVG
jgi:hypothetical protein